MSFDIPQIHIPDNSLEALAVERMMNTQHVGPEEAVRLILRGAAVDRRNAAQRMIGLFSNEEDSAIMDEVIRLSTESRQTETTRDIGL